MSCSFALLEFCEKTTFFNRLSIARKTVESDGAAHQNVPESQSETRKGQIFHYNKVMATFKTLTNIWQNVREVDLRPIREEALREIRLALVGEPGSGRQALAEQLRHDVAHPSGRSNTPLLILAPDAAEPAASADLIILLINPAAPNIAPLQALTHGWMNAGKKVMVFYNRSAIPAPTEQADPVYLDLELVWDAQRVLVGAVDDITFLQKEFVPAVMKLLPDHLLSLGRHFPLFRVAVAHEVINDTSLTNTAYALSTGLAEIIPALNLPFNIADMVVLTKAQAFLVYRLGLTLGFSTHWQDYLAEFGGVLGGGFAWRQLARSLIGLVPVWGIVPKMAVAYAGTFVVGHTVLRWYLTGRHIKTRQIREMYRQAFTQGKAVARLLLIKARRPKSRLPKPPRLRLGRRKAEALPSPAGEDSTSSERVEASVPNNQICPDCGESSAADARFCQYCGRGLVVTTS
jgi:uncharacterized protein (DUF697 family)